MQYGMLFKQHIRLSRIALFIAAGTLAIAPMVLAQDIDKVDKSTNYLALGDSLAFGLTPSAPANDLSQQIGYAKLVAGTLHKKLANAACPGETSGSILDPNAPDFGCTEWKANICRCL